MALKIKGFRKGLRYITQIFDPKDHELQIGFPTDVKHVAHIGWDGPSVNAPSWMNEFHSAPLSATVTPETGSPVCLPWGSQEISLHSGIQDSPVSSPVARSPIPRSRRRASSNATNAEAPKHDSSGAPRHSRRHQSDADKMIDSPDCEPRRHPRSSESNGRPESPKNLPAVPRQSQRRRPKGSTGSNGSSRLPRSKGPEPKPEAEEGPPKLISKPKPVPQEEGELL